MPCWPRCWWWPFTHPLEFDDDEWKRQHDEVSTTIRRTMLTLIGCSFFCLVTLGAPDISLLSVDAKIKVPFVGAEVGYSSFLIIGPLILSCLTIYLHIFLGFYLSLGSSQKSKILPFLFNMPSRMARVISFSVFYILPPIVLVAFVIKALPRTSEAYWLTLYTIFFVIVLLWLLIRRCPAKYRSRIVPILSIAIGICLFIGFFTLLNESAPVNRRLALYKADLSSKDLSISLLFISKFLYASLLFSG